jgi:hypothetical protein
MPECNHLDHTSAVIENDRHCAACGYNLHGMRYDGLCPECGREVANATVPSDLHFGSFRSIRRTRFAIGAWIIALVLPAVGTMIFTFTIVAGIAFWPELANRHSKSFVLYRAAIYCWVYRTWVAALFHSLAIVMITKPWGPQHERFKPRLGTAAIALTLLSYVYLALAFYWDWSGLTSPSVPVYHGVTWSIASAASVLAPCLAWVYLTLRIDRERAGRLRSAMWLTLAAPVMLGLAQIFAGIVNLTRPSNSVPAGVIFTTIEEPPIWWTLLSNVNQAWTTYGDPVCRFALLFMLWAYVRRLTAALPKPKRAILEKLRPIP